MSQILTRPQSLEDLFAHATSPQTLVANVRSFLKQDSSEAALEQMSDFFAESKTEFESDPTSDAVRQKFCNALFTFGLTLKLFPRPQLAKNHLDDFVSGVVPFLSGSDDVRVLCVVLEALCRTSGFFADIDQAAINSVAQRCLELVCDSETETGLVEASISFLRTFYSNCQDLVQPVCPTTPLLDRLLCLMCESPSSSQHCVELAALISSLCFGPQQSAAETMLAPPDWPFQTTDAHHSTALFAKTNPPPQVNVERLSSALEALFTRIDSLQDAESNDANSAILETCACALPRFLAWTTMLDDVSSVLALCVDRFQQWLSADVSAASGLDVRLEAIASSMVFFRCSPQAQLASLFESVCALTLNAPSLEESSREALASLVSSLLPLLDASSLPDPSTTLRQNMVPLGDPRIIAQFALAMRTHPNGGQVLPRMAQVLAKGLKNRRFAAPVLAQLADATGKFACFIGGAGVRPFFTKLSDLLQQLARRKPDRCATSCLVALSRLILVGSSCAELGSVWPKHCDRFLSLCLAAVNGEIFEDAEDDESDDEDDDDDDDEDEDENDSVCDVESQLQICALEMVDFLFANDAFSAAAPKQLPFFSEILEHVCSVLGSDLIFDDDLYVRMCIIKLVGTLGERGFLHGLDIAGLVLAIQQDLTQASQSSHSHRVDALKRCLRVLVADEE